MTNMELDYSDVTEIFKEKLKVDNIVKKISSVFLNSRYSEKIDYKPYFQRNYVWDNEKASYFIESILLGTEIPPLVLFQTKEKNEVIDGRQRYETIERFLADKFALSESGLHCLKTLSGKKYSQLSDAIREQFEETRIRILQFRVVNEPKLEAEKEDKIKKEIFRRYNSGITPLAKEEIERAAYINDSVSYYFYKKIDSDKQVFKDLCRLFLPVSKGKALRRDKINTLVVRIRTLITLPYIPIYSYAHGSSKFEIIKRYYELMISKNDPKEEYEKFTSIIEYILAFDKKLSDHSCLHNSKLFYETLYWGLAVLNSNVSDEKLTQIAEKTQESPQDDILWQRTINNTQKDVSLLFEPTGSHYYSSINNRYNYIANIFTLFFDVDYLPHLKDAGTFSQTMSIDIGQNELQHYQLNKPLPETLTIEDIISDMQKNRFLVRPEYQRSEVTNKQKASYLMESILLGINIPPIFVFKRKDKIKEVVDGQQRILTILGFLGKTYKDENGQVVTSSKDQFKLSKLKILTELNGLNINTISQKYENTILEFPMDVIEIDSSLNPEFDQTDLFSRLNSKPYPIKENTFEMWNAYVDKEIILHIRSLADKYENIVFRAKDTRMKIEELITSLAYLDYRLAQGKTDIEHILNIYKKNNKFCSRIMSKDLVTKVLSDVSNRDPSIFLSSIHSTEDFAIKISMLTDNDPRKLRNLYAHSRKGTQFKADQNYYFLWMLLRNISKDSINNNREIITNAVVEMFKKIQQPPVNYSLQMLLCDIKEFSPLQLPMDCA